MDILYSIIYPTVRKDPKLKWFVESLLRDIDSEDLGRTQLVVVDRWAGPGTRDTWLSKQGNLKAFADVVHTPPKPNVWCGEHRLTKTDYFAASNYRNTGLLHAKGEHVVFVDDLSVVMPGWWHYVQESRKLQEIYLGTYSKELDMRVVKGELKSYEHNPIGQDTRLKPHMADPFYCTGSWMYGCSLAGPIEAFLQINGFDEDCDSMGSEDYVCGMMISKAGWKFKFCPRMKTIESEELHEDKDGPVLRIIKPIADTDASHVILNMVQAGRDKGAFYSNKQMTLREAREIVLTGGPMPECNIPQHDWRDGQPLSEM